MAEVMDEPETKQLYDSAAAELIKALKLNTLHLIL